jgi:DNA topoisomerase VI subunit B
LTAEAGKVHPTGSEEKMTEISMNDEDKKMIEEVEQLDATTEHRRVEFEGPDGKFAIRARELLPILARRLREVSMDLLTREAALVALEKEYMKLVALMLEAKAERNSLQKALADLRLALDVIQTAHQMIDRESSGARENLVEALAFWDVNRKGSR